MPAKPLIPRVILAGRYGRFNNNNTNLDFSFDIPNYHYIGDMEWSSKNLLNQPTVIKRLSQFFVGFLLGVLMYSFVNFNFTQSTKEMYLSGFLGAIVLLLVTVSNGFLNIYVPFKKFPGLRLLSGILWDVVLGFLLIWVSYLGYITLWQIQIEADVQMELLTKLAILLFCVSILYNIIYFAFYAYNNYVRGQLMELQLERKQAELQLNVLKSQLSPHFLFNSINTLATLFEKDIERAEVFIRALGTSYQYTLEKYQSSLVRLSEELVFAKAYIVLIETRFGAACKIDLQIDKEMMDKRLPPLSLQLLIENAVKHNGFDVQQPLLVKVNGANNRITVSNKKSLKKLKMSSTKLGLKNITSRYALLGDSAVEINNGNTHFVVHIPLLS